MMPKSVKRFSDDIMLYLFELEADSDFRSRGALPHPDESRSFADRKVDLVDHVDRLRPSWGMAISRREAVRGYWLTADRRLLAG
ncbi:hypothetical protein ACFSQT_23475 [Mesorhizobium calcicola]|uniref:Uncharacterized protein n=1 Tax=Mesorhizobium calcicola TaxID=1300310 RepID=A0ABW4WK94_9HYPH